MVVLRSLLFNIAFYAGTAVACLTLFWAPFVGRRTALAVARFYLRCVGFLERTLIGLDYRMVGAERLPPAPFIVAAKHQSAWETMKLHLLFDAPAVVLKRELFRIPIWGRFARVVGTIGVDRSGGTRVRADLIAQAGRAAAEGRAIVIFPQGTRTAPGTWRSYKHGVAALYEGLGLPVVPMALNSGLFWGRRTFRKRPGTVTVEFLDPIAPGLSRTDFQATLIERLETASNRLSVAAGGPATEWPRPSSEADQARSERPL